MSHDVPILRELVVLAGVSLVVLLLFQRLRLPAIVGFMVSGILIGPSGLGLIRDTDLIRTLAEFGVVLLLFMVGLEFSLADLRRLGRRALVGGGLQVTLTIAVVASALMLLGQHPARALFFGMLVSLSSTAVVFKLLSDRLELTSPHGRLTVGVLVFQDLAAIGFLLAAPMLGRWLNAGAVPEPSLGGLLGSLAVVVAVALGLAWAHRVFPWLVGRASRAGSREAFLFGVALVALGAAYLTSRLGASLALGAFLAGLMLAESDLRTQIAADVLPFRDALASLFFVAIGMSLDRGVVAAHPWLVLGSTAGLVAIKAVLTLVALRLASAPTRVALGASLALAQVGEFSFVIAQSGSASGLIGAVEGQAFTAGAVFSLMLTPLMVAGAPRWALALDLERPRWMRVTAPRVLEPQAAIDQAALSPLLADHVVVGGAGLNGRNVARVLRAVHLPHLVVDLDPDGAQTVLAEGSPALLGDIARPLVQKQAGIARARVLVLALSDPTATRHACLVARELSPKVFIVVRTHSVAAIDGLYAVGADQVIPEEFETSIEIFTSVLHQFHVPHNIIEAQITVLRQERYGLLRGRKLPGAVIEQLDTILELGTTDTFLLLQNSRAVGRTLEELGLDGGGARVVAVVRGGEAITAVEGSLRLRVGDTLVLIGAHVEIEQAFDALS